eukprot:Rmarinus@m.14893
MCSLEPTACFVLGQHHPGASFDLRHCDERPEVGPCAGGGGRHRVYHDGVRSSGYLFPGTYSWEARIHRHESRRLWDDFDRIVCDGRLLDSNCPGSWWYPLVYRMNSYTHGPKSYKFLLKYFCIYAKKKKKK